MICPVCAYPSLPFPPTNYYICPSCGTEFGNDDEDRTHAELRADWIARGAPWFFKEPPVDWNPWWQLILGGYGADLPPVPEIVRSGISAQFVMFLDTGTAFITTE